MLNSVMEVAYCGLTLFSDWPVNYGYCCITFQSLLPSSPSTRLTHLHLPFPSFCPLPTQLMKRAAKEMERQQRLEKKKEKREEEQRKKEEERQKKKAMKSSMK